MQSLSKSQTGRLHAAVPARGAAGYFVEACAINVLLLLPLWRASQVLQGPGRGAHDRRHHVQPHRLPERHALVLGESLFGGPLLTAGLGCHMRERKQQLLRFCRLVCRCLAAGPWPWHGRHQLPADPRAVPGPAGGPRPVRAGVCFVPRWH